MLDAQNGIETPSASEVPEQVIRILLGALGSVVGIVPAANTGGTKISMLKRLPTDPSIKKLIRLSPAKHDDA
ncbi:MAG: DUF3703 domain-containing protein [Pseudomonadota bacterium]